MTTSRLPVPSAARPCERSGRPALVALVAFLACALVAPAATAQLAVYTDSLQNGFVDWGWGTYDLAQTAVVHSGTAAISFEPDNWDGTLPSPRRGLHRDGVRGDRALGPRRRRRGAAAHGGDPERREPRGVGRARGLRRRGRDPRRDLGEGDGAVLGAGPFDRELGRALAPGFLGGQPGDDLRRRRPAPGAHGAASPAARRRRGDGLGRPGARPAAREPADLRRELRVGGAGRRAEVARAALGRELGDPLQLAERHVEQGDGLVLHERPRGQPRPREPPVRLGRRPVPRRDAGRRGRADPDGAAHRLDAEEPREVVGLLGAELRRPDRDGVHGDGRGLLVPARRGERHPPRRRVRDGERPARHLDRDRPRRSSRPGWTTSPRSSGRRAAAASATTPSTTSRPSGTRRTATSTRSR